MLSFSLSRDGADKHLKTRFQLYTNPPDIVGTTMFIIIQVYDNCNRLIQNYYFFLFEKEASPFYE